MKIELASGINGQQAVGLIELKKIADEGDVEASNLLGIWLLSGLNCSPDVQMAAYYFEKAAQKGNTEAMIYLALCYAEGRGVGKDFNMAELWIRAADEFGDKDANVPARQIYISTIGHHRPNLREYTDFLFQMVFRNKTYSDEAETVLKDALIANLILSEAGKHTSMEELIRSETKASENDIKSFELLNDVFSGDALQTAEPPVGDSEKNKILDGILSGVDGFSRDDIADRIVILYHLCTDIVQKRQLETMGAECKKGLNCDVTLTWFCKAQYGIIPPVVGTFGPTLAVKGITVLREKLNVLEETELAHEISVEEDDLGVLLVARKRLNQNEQYSDEIKNSWFQKISQRIIELEDSELSKRFTEIEDNIDALKKLRTELKVNKQQYENVVIERWQQQISERIFAFIDRQIDKEYKSIQNDYDALYKMLRSLRQDEQEAGILEKWDVLLSERIVITQENKLKELCSALDGKSYQELTSLIQTIKERYSFDNTLSQFYISEVDKSIASIERQKLDEIVSDIEGRSSLQYEKVIEEIKGLHFNPANTAPYIDIVSQHRNCAQIVETCTDENLASWDLSELEKYSKVINNSTLRSEKKTELLEKVNSFITLILECKDAKTISLLKDCEEESVVSHSMEMLNQLRSKVNDHQILKKDLKKELLDRLDAEIGMRTFEQKFSEARDNYDSMLAVFDELAREGEKLPQDYRTTLEERVRNGIVKLQREALARLVTDIERLPHHQIKEVINNAKHFDFDKEILNETLTALDSHLDAVEIRMLTKICGDISSCTIENLETLRERIRGLGFKFKNTKPFKAKIDARYEDLVFEGLTQKCTQRELLQPSLTKDGVADLLSELQNCGKDEVELEPYIKRVSAFLEVQNQLHTDVSILYQNYFDKLQAFAVSVLNRLTFPEYSPLNAICVFNPSMIPERSLRLDRFKIEGLERIVFIFDETPGRDSLEGGFCITNLAIHCLTENGPKYIPLESITDIKAGKVFTSISISYGTDKFKFDISESFDVRHALANALLRIVSVAKEYKKMAANENRHLATSYSAKYDECFAHTPIPNDETVVDQAIDVTQEEVCETETIVNSPSLSPAELVQMVPESVVKYGLSGRYLVVGTQVFMKKLSKAKAAYAPYDQHEIPLMLEDHTLFGSAKDGFLLTSEALYVHTIHPGGTNGKVPLDRIVSVFDSYDAKLKLHNICMNTRDLDVTSESTYCISFCSDASVADKLIQFWSEILKILGISELKTDGPESSNKSLDSNSTSVAGTLPWLCSCGKTSEGNFCPNCGARREQGLPMWKCSCGCYNKGNFCSNCGSSKP